VLQVKNFQAATEYGKQDSVVQDKGLDFKEHVSMSYKIRRSTEDGKLPDAIKAGEGVTAAIDLCCCHGNQSSVVLQCFSLFKDDWLWC
ncbi:hypothetical protein HPG69_003331, partial [Diceros bicornis minor]